MTIKFIIETGYSGSNINKDYINYIEDKKDNIVEYVRDFVVELYDDYYKKTGGYYKKYGLKIV